MIAGLFKLLLGSATSKLITIGSIAGLLYLGKCAYDKRLVSKGEQIGRKKTIQEVNTGEEIAMGEAKEEGERVKKEIKESLNEANKQKKGVERSRNRLDSLGGKK